MAIYTLEEPDAPWWDYGGVLVSGITSRLPRIDGLLQLERTGPFVPPIVLASGVDLVVTDPFRVALENSGLSGVSFRPVYKRHIVHLGWETWDLNAAEPAIYPESGSPEDYIIARPHSAELARQIGELWEIVLEEHARFVLYAGISNWDGTDWFLAGGTAASFVSESAKEWLTSHARQWIRLTEVP